MMQVQVVPLHEARAFGCDNRCKEPVLAVGRAGFVRDVATKTACTSPPIELLREEPKTLELAGMCFSAAAIFAASTAGACAGCCRCWSKPGSGGGHLCRFGWTTQGMYISLWIWLLFQVQGEWRGFQADKPKDFSSSRICALVGMLCLTSQLTRLADENRRQSKAVEPDR